MSKKEIIAKSSEIRKLSDSPRCQKCNKILSRAEAHFFCRICRKKCPKNCTACLANEFEDWRKNLLLRNEKSRCRKKLLLRSEKSRFPKKLLLRKEKSPSLYKFCSCSKNRGKDEKKTKEPKIVHKDEFSERVKGFKEMLFTDSTNFVLRPELLANGINFNNLPSKLKERFLTTRNSLTRLLATSSMCFHLSENKESFIRDNKDFMNMDEGIESMFSSLIKHKANELGTIIFEIRRFLLSQTTLKPSVSNQLIYGEINPTQSILGDTDTLLKHISK